MLSIVLNCGISWGLNYPVTLTRGTLHKQKEQKLTRTIKRASAHQLLLHHNFPKSFSTQC